MALFPQKPIVWLQPDRNSPVSMQVQIARWLERRIETGELRPGDRLPSEAVLVEKFGVSRVTLRLAIDELVSRGLISRAHGKGTFAASTVFRHDLNARRGFFDLLLSKGKEPEARLMAFIEMVPPRRVAKTLGLAPGSAAISVDRLYLSSGRPIAFGAGWLTPDARILSHADVETRSTAALHAEILNHPVTSAVSTLGAELAGTAIAGVLGLRPRSAVLVLTRTRYDATGCPREHNRFTVDPRSFEFTWSADGRAADPPLLSAVAV